jgi:hypothetical protein
VPTNAASPRAPRSSRRLCAAQRPLRLCVVFAFRFAPTHRVRKSTAIQFATNLSHPSSTQIDGLSSSGEPASPCLKIVAV